MTFKSKDWPYQIPPEPCAFCGRITKNQRRFALALTGLWTGSDNCEWRWACRKHGLAAATGKLTLADFYDMIGLTEDEHEDLIAAAGAMARHWKHVGLGNAVKAIGRDEGIAGARAMLAAYFWARQERRRRDELNDEIPF